jgi:hypothetical protein
MVAPPGNRRRSLRSEIKVPAVEPAFWGDEANAEGERLQQGGQKEMDGIKTTWQRPTSSSWSAITSPVHASATSTRTANGCRLVPMAWNPNG